MAAIIVATSSAASHHADEIVAAPARRVEGEIKAGEAVAMSDGETRSERHGNGEREQA